MLFVFSKRKTWRSKYNIDSLRGGDIQGEGVGMFIVQKRGHFIEVSQHYNLSLICSCWNGFVRGEASIWRTKNIFCKSPCPSLIYLDSTVSQFLVNCNCVDTCQRQFLCIYQTLLGNRNKKRESFCTPQRSCCFRLQSSRTKETK